MAINSPPPVRSSRQVVRAKKTAPGGASLSCRDRGAVSSKLPKEIAELMNAQGWDVTAQRISVVKSALKAKKKEAAPTLEAGPVVPKDAVSVGLLVKAKKLAAQFGSIEEAKAALNALAQLLD
jgi:hypothetical protein